MKVLLTGGTGFIGTSLCRELAERGHDVTALARDPRGADLPEGVETAVGDVTAYESIADAFEGQDAAVNLVALSPLFKPRGGDERHFEVHLGGTENAVRAAEEHGVDRFVQLSALGADPEGPTAYIRSKGEAEAVVRESDLEWTVFRPSVVFGDGGEFVPFTKRLAPPYFTPLPGGGRTRFQPLWVEDFVPMLADAVEGRAPDTDEDAEDVDDDGSAFEDTTPAIRRVEAGDDGTDEVGDFENPHDGRTYEVGGPEVLTLAEVARVAHAADNKPVSVVSVPMALAGIGLKTLGALPGAPMGADQYRSLQFDNTVAENDVGAFGVREGDLTTLSEYLGVEPPYPGQ